MDRLGAGDVVLLTGRKRVLAVGEVGLVFRNPAFARALWNPEPRTCAWDNVYRLLHLSRTEIPYDAAKTGTVLAGDGFAVAE